MKFLRALFVLIDMGIFAIGALTIGLVIFPLLSLFIKGKERREYFSSIIHYSWKFFIWVMEKTGEIKVNVNGDLSLIKGKIVVASHPSLIDIILLIGNMPRSLCIAKKEILKNIVMRNIVKSLYIVNDDPELFQKNAVWLIENNIVHGRMKIEFYREIGDFEAARRLFALFKFVGIEEDSVLYAIRERLDAHDCKVFKIEEKILSIKDIKAGNVKRLLGHIIDVAFIIFITIMILKFTTIAESATISNLEIDLTYFASYFLYFLGMEAISNGKTIGKKLLRMSVTNNKGESPSMSKIGLRTLCRFIPFDILSFLWGGNWHDNISGTYVVSDNELKKFKEQHQ